MNERLGLDLIRQGMPSVDKAEVGLIWSKAT